MSLARDNKKRISCILLTVFICLSLCACGDEIPDLTEEQQEIITNYSALLLLRYDKASPNRLMPEDSIVHIDFVGTDPGASGEIIPAAGQLDIAVNSDPTYSSDSTSYTDTVTGTSDQATAYADGFDSFTEGEGISIAYSGRCDILDSYPDGEDANPFLSIEASTGNKLLVIHFDLTGTSADPVSVNLGRLGLRYRVSVNGGANKYIMTTLLPNDLMSYVGEVASGETVDVVAVCEISPEEAESIQKVDFTIKGEDHSAVLSLQ